MKSHRFKIIRRCLYKTLNLPHEIPKDFEGKLENVPVYDWILGKERIWHRLSIVVKPTPQKQKFFGRVIKSSAHRTFAVCGCGKEIPTGRLHQHLPYCNKHPVCTPQTVFEDVRSYTFLDSYYKSKDPHQFLIFSDWCEDNHYLEDAKWLREMGKQEMERLKTWQEKIAEFKQMQTVAQ